MYILIFILTLGISLFAQWRVKRMYRHFSQVPAASGRTGAEAAAAILHSAGITDVTLHEHDEMLGDHYDPLRKRLVLSSANYHGTSLAALGVAAHECGHAIQHQQSYAPLHIRMAAVSTTNFASQIVLWLPILGMFTGILSTYTGLWIMALAWGIIMLFNLITLPVEFDATRRAKLVLNQMGYIRSHEENDGVNQVLNAAAWTYVAALITSLAYLLWYVLPLLTGRDRD